MQNKVKIFKYLETGTRFIFFLLTSCLSLGCGNKFTFEFQATQLEKNTEKQCISNCADQIEAVKIPLDGTSFFIDSGFNLSLAPDPLWNWTSPKGGLPPYIYRISLSESGDCQERVLQAQSQIKENNFSFSPLSFEGSYTICLSVSDQSKTFIKAPNHTFVYSRPVQLKFLPASIPITSGESPRLDPFQILILDRFGNRIPGRSGSLISLELVGENSDKLSLNPVKSQIIDGTATFLDLQIENPQNVHGSFQLRAKIEGINVVPVETTLLLR